jgi:hypothetical protein
MTQKELKEVLDYNPETGIFRWKIRARPQNPVGSVAGSKRKNDYLQIRIKGKNFLAQRLAWLFMTGCWPVAELDHVNRDRTDNRWVNLREATRVQNAINSKDKKNSTGYPGVQVTKEGRFSARVRVGNKRTHLGVYATVEEAAAVVMALRRDLHGEFAG